MGYNYYAGDSNFFIPADKQREAFLRIWDSEMKAHSEVSDDRTLAEELEEGWEYDCYFDVDNNIIDIFPRNSRVDVDKALTLFELLAPSVRDGSYLMYYGEDGAQWGYQFKNGQVQEEDVVCVFYTDLTPEQKKTYGREEE